MELNLNNSSLENQVAFLKKLFDTIPYPIFVKNTKLEYIYANRICEEKNGFEPGGLNGKTDAELWEGKIQLVEEYNLADFALISSIEGQVAVLSSGLLTATEAVKLLDAMRQSAHRCFSRHRRSPSPLSTRG